MRTVIRVVVLLLLCVAAAAQTAARQEHPHRALTAYRRKTFGPRALAAPAASAGIGQLRNVPHEWGGGVGGFATRFASGFGVHVVKSTVEYGVAAWHDENLDYQPSHLQGTWPRMEYALKSTFWVPRTNRPGQHTVSLARISGSVGAGLISRAWQPASTATLGSGFATGGISVGVDVGVNMAREFWPERHHAAAQATPILPTKNANLKVFEGEPY
jgi:hypothetical protein